MLGSGGGCNNPRAGEIKVLDLDGKVKRRLGVKKMGLFSSCPIISL